MEKAQPPYRNRQSFYKPLAAAAAAVSSPLSSPEKKARRQSKAGGDALSSSDEEVAKSLLNATPSTKESKGKGKEVDRSHVDLGQARERSRSVSVAGSILSVGSDGLRKVRKKTEEEKLVEVMKKKRPRADMRLLEGGDTPGPALPPPPSTWLPSATMATTSAARPSTEDSKLFIKPQRRISFAAKPSVSSSPPAHSPPPPLRNAPIPARPVTPPRPLHRPTSTITSTTPPYSPPKLSVPHARPPPPPNLFNSSKASNGTTTTRRDSTGFVSRIDKRSESPVVPRAAGSVTPTPPTTSKTTQPECSTSIRAPPVPMFPRPSPQGSPPPPSTTSSTTPTVRKWRPTTQPPPTSFVAPLLPPPTLISQHISSETTSTSSRQNSVFSDASVETSRSSSLASTIVGMRSTSPLNSPPAPMPAQLIVPPPPPPPPHMHEKSVTPPPVDRTPEVPTFAAPEARPVARSPPVLPPPRPRLPPPVKAARKSAVHTPMAPAPPPPPVPSIFPAPPSLPAPALQLPQVAALAPVQPSLVNDKQIDVHSFEDDDGADMSREMEQLDLQPASSQPLIRQPTPPPPPPHLAPASSVSPTKALEDLRLQSGSPASSRRMDVGEAMVRSSSLRRVHDLEISDGDEDEVDEGEMARRRKENGKGKEMDFLVLGGSSEDEEEVEDSRMRVDRPLRRLRKRAREGDEAVVGAREKRKEVEQVRPRKLQVWEQVDPEDRISTCHYGKHIVITLHSIHLPGSTSPKAPEIVFSTSGFNPTTQSPTPISSKKARCKFVRTPSTSTHETYTTSSTPARTIQVALPAHYLRHLSSFQLTISVTLQRDPTSTSTTQQKLETNIPLTRSSDFDVLVTYKPLTTFTLFSTSSPSAPSEGNVQLSWELVDAVEGRRLSAKEGIEEIKRRLERVKIERFPVWIPNAKKRRDWKELPVLDLKDGKRSYDFATMAPLAPGTMVGPLDTSTMAVERFEDLIRTVDESAEVKMIWQLHHRWTTDFPSPGSIFKRERDCWTYFAPVVHHFELRQHLVDYLQNRIVQRDKYTFDEAVKLRYPPHSLSPQELTAKVDTRLMSQDEARRVLKSYDAEVLKVQTGKRETYEDWWDRVEEDGKDDGSRAPRRR